jgi:hypothetical protein
LTLARPPETRAPEGLSELAAAKLIESHGGLALAILEQRAELAEELGHRVAATTWHAMADAAARLLRCDRVTHLPPAPAIRRCGALGRPGPR